MSRTGCGWIAHTLIVTMFCVEHRLCRGQVVKPSFWLIRCFDWIRSNDHAAVRSMRDPKIVNNFSLSRIAHSNKTDDENGRRKKRKKNPIVIFSFSTLEGLDLKDSNSLARIVHASLKANGRGKKNIRPCGRKPHRKEKKKKKEKFNGTIPRQTGDCCGTEAGTALNLRTRRRSSRPDRAVT